jgi:hypothetical protein
MKSGPKADYPVLVYEEPANQDPPEAALYKGVFNVELNHVVHIVFVPDISTIAPPWDDHLLAEVDEIATVEQARLSAALPWPYVITPNETLAGTDEAFEWGHDHEFGVSRGVVFYVSAREFDQYSDALASLAKINEYSSRPKKSVSELRGYDVIGFLERRVLASRWVRPEHAAMLCLTPPGS